VALPVLPSFDRGVATQLAPPAAVAGGVVAGGLALQFGARKLVASVSRGARLALFAAVVAAAAAKILGAW
jgi:hypothetical protein